MELGVSLVSRLSIRATIFSTIILFVGFIFIYPKIFYLTIKLVLFLFLLGTGSLLLKLILALSRYIFLPSVLGVNIIIARPDRVTWKSF